MAAKRRTTREQGSAGRGRPTMQGRCCHSPLTHAVGARQVELQSIGSRSFSHLSQLLPILLVVRTHNAVEEIIFLFTKYHNGLATPIRYEYKYNLVFSNCKGLCNFGFKKDKGIFVCVLMSESNQIK